jgi:DNA (cytosine-5)-methyltransferase 1
MVQVSFLNSNDFDFETSDSNIRFIDVYQKLDSKKLKVLSLFSGCGGMDLGFLGGFEIFGNKYENNPFEIVYSNDIVNKACETYLHNFQHKIHNEDIRNVDEKKLPQADIVIGGFPCQDFSHAGKRKGLTSDRGRLYLEMKRVIDHIQPIAFIAENVDGIRTSSRGTDTSALDTIIEDFVKSGYEVTYKQLNAADYGVPQTRIRIIITGIRKDVFRGFYYPKPIRGLLTELPWMTSKEAIDDLWDKLGNDNIPNHSFSDYSKARFYEGRKMQGNYRISANKPSNTIRAEHHGNIEGHYRSLSSENPDNPKNWRRLSVRECARLQTFPDNFVFPGSASDAYRQIGNAVPPVLGWHIARALYLSLSL